MAFVEAKAVKMRPKVLLVGAAGARKTLGALGLSKDPSIKLAVIDTENGTPTYAGQFRFDVKHTDDPVEVETEIDKLLAEPQGYTTLVLDSITPLTTTLDRQADESLRPRANPKGGKLSPFEMTWGYGTRFGMQPKRRIESMMRGILAKLRRIDMGVVVTARQKQEWVDLPGGGLRRGDMSFDSIQGLDYEFDLVLHLEKIGPSHTATVRKSRGFPQLAGIQVIDNFTPDTLLELFGPEAWGGKSTPKPVATEEQLLELEALVTELAIEPQALQKALSGRGVSLVQELSPEQATDMIEKLRMRRAALMDHKQ